MNEIHKKTIRYQLLCCRVCLMDDCRLYNIQEYKLNDAFLCVTGTPVLPDGLPPYLCAYCFVLLLKCSSFRDMSLQSQEVMLEMLNGKIDTDCIRRNRLPQRCINLAQTEVEIIELSASKKYPNHDYEEDMMVEALDEELQNVADKTADDNDGHIYYIKDGVISKGNTETVEHNMSMERIYEDDSDLGLGNEVESVESNANDHNYEQSLVLKHSENSKRKAKAPEDDMLIERIHEDDEIEINDDDCEHSLVLKDSNSKKASTSKGTAMKFINACYDVHQNEVKLRNENKEKLKMMTIELKDNAFKFEVADNDDDEDDCFYYELIVDGNAVGGRGQFNYEAFESKYNVKTIVLSKEEQLEEIATRKKSSNYLRSQYRCEDCGKGFNFQDIYDKHRAKHSPNFGPHSCEICGVRFPIRSRCQMHATSHKLKFICKECNFVSRVKTQAMAHHAVHAGKKYECPYCSKDFVKSSTYFSHVRLAHPALNVVCDECGETFVSESGLRQHKRMTHYVKSQFKCNTCSVNFNSAEALKTHMATAGDHTDLRPCEQCGANCASEDALQKHVEETHPSKRCEECDMTFANSEAYNTHLWRKHAARRPRARRPPPRARTRARPRPARPVMCDQCGVSVYNSSFLVYHMREHLGIRPYACPHCPKTFVVKHRLKYHMRMHTGEKPFQCPKCPLAFGLKGNYKRHYQTAHLGIRGAYPCHVCGRASTTRASLKVHVRAVHGHEGWPKRHRDKRRPRAQASEAQASEAQASEAQASEAQASEAQASEAQASEAQASEAQASEAQASEAQADNKLI